MSWRGVQPAFHRLPQHPRHPRYHRAPAKYRPRGTAWHHRQGDARRHRRVPVLPRPRRTGSAAHPRRRPLCQDHPHPKPGGQLRQLEDRAGDRAVETDQREKAQGRAGAVRHRRFRGTPGQVAGLSGAADERAADLGPDRVLRGLRGSAGRRGDERAGQVAGRADPARQPQQVAEASEPRAGREQGREFSRNGGGAGAARPLQPEPHTEFRAAARAGGAILRRSFCTCRSGPAPKAW